jgi:hypothetical protein
MSSEVAVRRCGRRGGMAQQRSGGAGGVVGRSCGAVAGSHVSPPEHYGRWRRGSPAGSATCESFRAREAADGKIWPTSLPSTSSPIR